MSSASLHSTPLRTPYVTLVVANAFKDLTPRQRLYAHHMCRASFAGLPVVAAQISPESLPLLRLFHALYRAQPIEDFKATAATAGNGVVTAEDVTAFIEYSALVYANAGNYLSFGDSKFVPTCSREAFTAIARSAVSADDAAALVTDELVAAAYSLEASKLTLAFPPAGQSTYYSPNITQADAELANDFLTAKSVDGVNTRVWKSVDPADGTTTLLTIRVASAAATNTKATAAAAENFKGCRVVIEHGDFSAEMTRVAAALTEAQAFAENATQERMLGHYIAHFLSGDVADFDASQREWVTDIAPAVETNLGFIESYRDPSGVRAEWEGLVAVVNTEESRVFGKLVANAEKFIAQLPWGKPFEIESFRAPDFTSLEVINMATSGIPLGVNIPNSAATREQFGFKNVYLGNVAAAIDLSVKSNHVTPEDWAVYTRACAIAGSVNVGIHELLGHGTGRLLTEDAAGVKNFPADLIDPVSGAPVATWYKPGESWGSVFGGDASSIEECRAEAVSLYLCIIPELLEIFGLTTAEEQDDAVFVVWHRMVLAGLVGLEMYTPETRQWRQAHMRARFCILQALLRCEPAPLVTITRDAVEGLVIKLDRERIRTDGLKAIGELLVNINVNKATANAARGRAYYDDLTSVSDEFVEYRAIVLERRKPRRQFVQAHTTLAEGGADAAIREFPASVEGMIESMVTRHDDIPL